MRFNITSNLYCYAYGHNYHRLEKIKKNAPELICKRCKKYFTYDSNGEIVPFTKNTSKKLKILQKI